MHHRQSAYTTPNNIASIPAKTNVEAEEACGLATELKIKQILLGSDLGNICMNDFLSYTKAMKCYYITECPFFILISSSSERREKRYNFMMFATSEWSNLFSSLED